MSLSAQLIDDLGWWIDGDTALFFDVFESAVHYIKEAQKRDDSEKENRKKTLASIEALSKAFFKLTEQARKQIDVSTATLLELKNPSQAAVCDAINQALREPVPKNNKSAAVTALKQYVMIFIEQGWLQPETSKTAPLVQVVRKLIQEAGVNQNAHSVVRSAIEQN